MGQLVAPGWLSQVSVFRSGYNPQGPAKWGVHFSFFLCPFPWLVLSKINLKNRKRWGAEVAQSVG